MKRLFYCLILSLFPVVVSAQNSTKMNNEKELNQLWNRIAALEKKGEIKEAINISDSLLKEALEAKAFGFAVKTMEKNLLLNRDIDWRSTTKVLERFKEIESAFDTPEGEFLYSREMHYLSDSYLYRTYTFDQKVEFIDQIVQLSDELAKYPPDYNKENKRYFDQYFDNYTCDNLQQEALFYLAHTLSEMISQDTEEAHNLFMKIYPKLEASVKKSPNLHLKTKYEYISWNTLGNREKLLKDLEQLASGSGKLPAKAEILYNIADLTLQQTDLEKKEDEEIVLQAERIYDQIIRDYKGSRFNKMAKEEKDEINRASATLAIPDNMYPGAGFNSIIKYRNLSEINFKIYKINSPEITTHYGSNSEVIKKLLSESTLVYDTTYHKLEYPKGIYMTISDKITLSEEGRYFTLTSFKKEQNLNQFRISKVAASQISDDDNLLYVTDLISGKPYNKVGIKFLKEVRERYKHYYKPAEIEDQLLKQDGFTSIPYPEISERRVRFIAYSADDPKDIFSQPGTLYKYDKVDEDDLSEDMREVRGEIFSDRKLYRPEDPIHFKALIYLHDPEGSKVLENNEITIRLLDARGNSLDSLEMTTNNFGSVSGEFSIPKNIMNGDHAIAIEECGVSISRTNIRIESYKPPTLFIDIEEDNTPIQFGDNIKVRGKVSNYAGFPINNASISYIVTRNISSDYNKGSRFQLGRIGTYQTRTIASGEVNSDSEGVFSLGIDAIRPFFIEKESKLRANYKIEFSISDEQGETIRKNHSFAVSDTPCTLSDNLEEIYIKGREHSAIKINISNSSGNPVEATGYYLLSQEIDPSRKGKITVAEGEFSSGKDITIDWNSLTSGEYILEYYTTIRERRYVERSKTIVINKDDTQMPCDTIKLSIPLPDERALLFGSSADRLYIEKQIYVDGKLAERKGIIHNSGLKKYHIPEKYRYTDAVLRLYFIKDGESHSITETFSAEQEVESLDIKITTGREYFEPDSKESITIGITGGEGEEKELLVSIYNKSNDRLGANSFHFSDWSYSHNYAPYISELFSNIPELKALYSRSMNTNKFLMEDAVVMESAPMAYASVVEEDVPLSKQSGRGLYGDDESEEGSPQEQQERSDFSETLAFIPHLTAGKESTSTITAPFNTNGLLSTFRILTMAHTPDMILGFAESEIVVRKEVMIMANNPLFIRERDKIFMQAKVVNLTEKEITGTASLSVSGYTDDTITPFEQLISGDKSHTITLAPGEQRNVIWEVNGSSETPMAVVTFSFDSPNHKDSEKRIIPILSMRELFTESESYILDTPGEKTIGGEKLKESLKNSSTREVKKVTLEINDPVSSAIASIPSIATPQGNNSISMALALSANLTGHKLVKDRPEIAEMIRELIKNEELQRSPLEINTEITNVLLSETPWAKIPGVERSRMESLEKILNEKDMKELRVDISTKLKELQNPDGGFGWFPRMGSSIYTTSLILEKYGQLLKTGAIEEFTQQESQMLGKALRYLDLTFSGEYLDSKYYYINDAVTYLYIASLYPHNEYDNETAKAREFYHQTLENEWIKASIMNKAYFASILINEGDIDFAKRVCKDLEQYLVKNESTGYFFPNAAMPFRGMMSSEIKAHSLLLTLYNELSETSIVRGIQQWLLFQKRNQMWENNAATSDAIFALLQTGVELPDYKITLNRRVKSGQTLKQGFNPLSNMIDIPVNLLEKKGEIATINLKNRSMLIVNLYYQYMDDIEEVEASETGMKIERRFFRKDAEGSKIKMTELTDGESLETGDEIVVRYYLKNEENRSFVQLKSMRSACLMPVTESSGYIWTGAAGAYREIKESVTNYYFQLLPEGEHQFEENFFVTQKGTFSSGLAEIQSLYAPEYRAKTAIGGKIVVNTLLSR